MRQELNDIAIKKCADVTAKFGQCARENGLMVVIKCRDHNKAMNDCLHQYTNPEQFELYRLKREQDMLDSM